MAIYDIDWPTLSIDGVSFDLGSDSVGESTGSKDCNQVKVSVAFHSS